ncbi:hypothetical protein ANN_03941 [Periplaneta americana]|uniref:RNase H type-1 domain-containing protein n=1 Tax=Periplaneta americana TaxID=6978 RepID=A0ABQ8T920_PERAM|nr:hypothetical protein ANN_03941 [Periplaneta americana]
MELKLVDHIKAFQAAGFPPTRDETDLQLNNKPDKVVEIKKVETFKFSCPEKRAKQFLLYPAVMQKVLAAVVYTIGHYVYFHYYMKHLMKKRALMKKDDDNGRVPLNLRRKIRQLKDLNWTIHFGWVKAHIGIEGNELADRLAKEAAEDGELPMSYNKKPLYSDYEVEESNHFATEQDFILPETEELETESVPVYPETEPVDLPVEPQPERGRKENYLLLEIPQKQIQIGTKIFSY